MTAIETITLFRPTGTKELQLVADSGYLRWPPRLPDQPIFYPVLHEAYATEIAREWNTKFDDKIGHVTRFAVTKVFLDRYQRQIVGGRQHEEYWIPAEDLDDMNANIVGPIEVIATFQEADRLDYEAKAKSHA
jgi:hypothetical protein